MRFHYGWYVCKGDAHFDDYDWCEQLFGESNPNGDWFCDYEKDLFYFREQKHAMWYELRWTSNTF